MSLMRDPYEERLLLMLERIAQALEQLAAAVNAVADQVEQHEAAAAPETRYES